MGSGELEEPTAESPASKSTPPVTQSGWRKIGAVTVGLGALMAWYGAASGVLRQTVAHVAAFLSEEVSPIPDGPSGVFCLVYWLVFLLLVTLSLYIAVLDIRYIRLRFLVDQREIFEHTLGNKASGKPPQNRAGDSN